ncbi:coronatine-insensitive 1, partial [Tanacetum coccineum]
MSRLDITPWIKEIAVKFVSLKALHIRGLVVGDEDLELLARTR